MDKQISIYKCTGTGYENGWYTNCNCRYRVFKGGRNTKKSYDILGYEVIAKILDNPLRNILIIRNTYNSNRLSTFSTLCMLIEHPVLNDFDISLSKYFNINKTDMTITYIPTGQIIVFRGMDDPQKIQGIRPTKGYFTDVYIEEAYELKSYEDFRKVDGSFRGVLPNGLFFQITFCLNAWDCGHWIYDKFFKGRFEDDYAYLSTHTYEDYIDKEYIGDFGIGLYLHTSTYKINEFRDINVYDVAMENMKEKALEIYKVEALGMWGNSTEAVYPEFTDDLIISRQVANNQRYYCYTIGIDTGLSDGQGKVLKGEDVKIHSAMTMELTALTYDMGKVICIDEYFHTNEGQVKKTEPQIMKEMISTIKEWKEKYVRHPDLMKGIIMVYVDCADIGFRQGLELEARNQQLFNIKFEPSTKLRIQTRVDFDRLLMSFGDYLISEACPNLIREHKNAKRGKKGECREDIDDHCLTAKEYSEAVFLNKLKRWKDFKER